MSWIRSSEGAAVGVLFVVLIGAVGTVAAISVGGTPPDAAAVGSEVQMNATVEDPFDGPPDQYTLQGSTGLENASWTVEVLNQGDPIETFDAGGESFSYDLNAEEGATDIEITLRGTVPGLSTFNYENIEAEEYMAMTLARVSNGTTTELDNWQVHRYTESSLAARNAIDAAIDAGARDASDDAQSALTNAIEFYDGANFEQAITNAEDAEELAEESSGGGPPMLLIGGAVVLLLIVIGAVVYVYRSNQQSGHKLQ